MKSLLIAIALFCLCSSIVTALRINLFESSPSTGYGYSISAPSYDYSATSSQSCYNDYEYSEGSCSLQTPCYPNPCQSDTQFCVASSGNYSCLSKCDDGYHYDSLEHKCEKNMNPCASNPCHWDEYCHTEFVSDSNAPQYRCIKKSCVYCTEQKLSKSWMGYPSYPSCSSGEGSYGCPTGYKCLISPQTCDYCAFAACYPDQKQSQCVYCDESVQPKCIYDFAYNTELQYTEVYKRYGCEPGYSCRIIPRTCDKCAYAICEPNQYPPPSGSYYTPSGSYYTPSGSYYTPSGSYYTPTGSYYTPTGSYYTPTGTYYTPTGSYYTPTGSYYTPTGGYYTPTSTYYTPTSYPPP